MTLIALFALMIFLFLCNFMSLGIVGTFFSDLMFGLTGVMAYLLPVLIFALYLYYVSMQDRDPLVGARILAILGLALIVCVFAELIGTDLSSQTGYDPAGIYTRSAQGRSGGGILGGTIAFVLYRLLKTFGTILILLVAAVACVYILAQRSILELARDKAMDARLHRLERMEEEERYREEHPEEFEEEDDEDPLERSHYQESRERYEDLQRERRERERRRREQQRAQERAGSRGVEGVPGNMWNTDLSADEAFAETAPDPLLQEAPTVWDPQKRDPEEDFVGTAPLPTVASPVTEAVKAEAFAGAAVATSAVKRSDMSSFAQGAEGLVSGTMEEALQENSLKEDSSEENPLDGMRSEAAMQNAEKRARRESEELHEIRPEDYWDEELLSPQEDPGDPSSQELPVRERPDYDETFAEENRGILRATIYRDGEEPEEAAAQREADSDGRPDGVSNGMESYGAYGADASASGQAAKSLTETEAQEEVPHEGQSFGQESEDFCEEVPQIRIIPKPAEPEQQESAVPGDGTTGLSEETDDRPVAAAVLPDIPVHTERENTPSELNEPDSGQEEISEGTRQEHPAPAASAAGEKVPSAETKSRKEYEFPPISLLRPGAGSRADSDDELRSTAQTLQTTLRNFGVNITITDISQGPSVTRYEMLPEMGVKVSKIVSLADDIKLALAATDIRIEAPIPGKSAIGIEVPNKEAQPVALRDIVDTDEFRNQKSKLAFAVGKDIAGKPVYGDIAKMPHVLIAGATGSGKSVCINTIIMSILFHARPEEVKLIMIDPKVVELSVYNSIPHLMIPVVTNPQKAAAALNWGVSEMEARYRAFADARVRDIKGYNEMVRRNEALGDQKKEDMHFMPQLVIIVDELADLMMVAKNDVETAICRLAQLARAAGIHLIIATQRPSVDVITGLIKANMPSRIAFRVSSGVDSRTILDMNGAEKLLGKGDMLFFPQGLPKPNRVQGCFVSDEEVTDVVNFLAEHDPVSEEETLRHQKEIDALEAGGSGSSAPGQDAQAAAESDVDDLFGSAGAFIIEKNNASIGLLQRKYRIGFNRAARIMDQLCEAGVVGDSEGTRARAILMTPGQFEEYCSENGYVITDR